MSEEGYLCMITLYAHALILLMFRVIGSCIMTYIILLCHRFQFIACFFYKFFFVLVVFVDLTLHVLFLSVLKNSKTHKNWKFSKKFDCLCCVYHMWVWPSTFVLMAKCIYELSLLCMHIYLCGKILKSMCDYCKSIFKLVMNDWSIVLMILIHA